MPEDQGAIDGAIQRVYAELPVKAWQTRLLRLHHDTTNALLSGDLLVADITFLDGAILHEVQKQVNYKALSYTWGDVSHSESLSLNGNSVFITVNLHDFLRQYADSCKKQQDAVSYIWIDAICINQANAAEKGQQVSNMLTFYEHAESVLVWLGSPSLHTGAAVAFLQQQDRYALGSVPATNDDDIIAGLVDLYSRPWLERIWIKQEVWAAKHIIVWCGQHALTWSQYRNLLLPEERTLPALKTSPSKLWKTIGELNLQDSKYGHALLGLEQRPKPEPSTIRQSRTQLQSTQPEACQTDIIALLEGSYYCKSTDLRDRIYALLGMCPDPGIEISYVTPASDVFEDLARTLIRRELNAGLILGLGGLFGTQEDIRLPSWVPDWRTIRHDANAHGIWKQAMILNVNLRKRKMEMEGICPLPPNVRGIRPKYLNRLLGLMLAEERGVLFLRGYVVKSITTETSFVSDQGIRMFWNPLTTPAGYRSFSKLELWQASVKSRTVALLTTSKERHARRNALRMIENYAGIEAVWNRIEEHADVLSAWNELFPPLDITETEPSVRARTRSYVQAFRQMDTDDVWAQQCSRQLECLLGASIEHQTSSSHISSSDSRQGLLRPNLERLAEIGRSEVSAQEQEWLRQQHAVLRLLGNVTPSLALQQFLQNGVEKDDLVHLGEIMFTLSISTARPLQIGDILAYCYGCGLPVILRPVTSAKSTSYTFVGLAICDEVDRMSIPSPDGMMPELHVDLDLLLHARAWWQELDVFKIV